MRIDLEYCQIGSRIGAHDLGGKFALVIQIDAHVGGAVDHVIVGEDVAFTIHDYARAQAVLVLILRLLMCGFCPKN